MRFAVFFRNLNLGRPRCPSRQQFEQAFTDAGATMAASFLTNGTLVFDTSSQRAAQRILAQASQAMAASCGLQEPGFLRSVASLQTLADTDPFAGIDPATVYERCITFLPLDADASALPAANTRGDVQVLRHTGTEVLSLSYQLGKSPGSPNAFIEKALGTPATTRAWNTVARLVGKYGSAG